MKTLQVKNLNLSFGDREILKDISFTISEKTRCALAGANGSGKSTLLKCLVGELSPESLELTITKGSSISYLPQEGIVLKDKTIFEIAEEGFDYYKPLIKELETLEKVERLNEKEQIKDAERINEIHEKLIDLGYWEREGKVETILLGLGFKKSDFSRKAKEFSGGYQMRLALSRILVEEPDFLLLDEPTNYLDIDTLTWLSQYLKGFPGGLILVSHDQDFLDKTITEVYKLYSSRLKKYKGNYSSYLSEEKEELKVLKKAKENQDGKIKKTEEFIDKFRYKATKAKQVQSRVKSLDKIERIEYEDSDTSFSFTFPPSPHSPNDVIKVENLYKSYGEQIIYSDFSFLLKKGERLAITGKNGIGKSTLLRILALKDKEIKGTVKYGPGVINKYFEQEVAQSLNDENTVLDELRSVATVSDEPRLRNLLGCFLFSGDDVFKKVSVLSGGEKSRLSLLKILLHKSNLLLLDEPTNHLDIKSKEALLKALKKYEGTIVFISHDKHFIKNLATKILYLSDEKPEFFSGDYEYFEYKLEEKEKQYEVRRNLKNAEIKENYKKEDSKENSYQVNKIRHNKIKSLEKEEKQLLVKIDEKENEIQSFIKELEKSSIYSNRILAQEILNKKEIAEKEKEALENKYLEILIEEEELKNEENN